MFLNQFSGVFVFTTYTSDIFQSSGSSLSPNESAIIVAFIQLCGLYVSTLCVDRFGRKVSWNFNSTAVPKTYFKFLDHDDNLNRWHINLPNNFGDVFLSQQN